MPIFGKTNKSAESEDAHTNATNATEVKELQSQIDTLNKELSSYKEQLSSYKEELSSYKEDEKYSELLSAMKPRAEKLGFTGNLEKIIGKTDSEITAYDKIVENLNGVNQETLNQYEEKSKILESEGSTPEVTTEEAAWDRLEEMGFSPQEAVLKAPEHFPEVFNSKSKED